ncbi:glycosyltransferase family 4 protein [Vicingaceae bacterium]|nr:glycosyltransferase family 4 protein [Vicingaceae bacterium]
MNALLLSEHYFPKIGGTVSYVENTAVTLSKKINKVYLLAPAVGELGKIVEEKHFSSPLVLLKLGVKSVGELNFDAEERNLYCTYIKNSVFTLSQNYNINLIHILFGLFIAEILDTKKLREKRIRTINTIHNIPPQECSNSWRGDSTLLYIKDTARKEIVGFMNRRRIQKNKFDVYIVPSEEVRVNLTSYVENSLIKVIGHGGAEVSVLPKERSSGPIRLLTVGGFVPHKNQHLIAEIAHYLLNNGVEFKWDVVGPIRNKRYYKYFLNAINKRKLDKVVTVSHNIPEETLYELYQSADLYLQLSSEEGFCMTVLDAVSYRLPVIATPVGAIPEMMDMVDGILIDLKDANQNKLIHHYIKIVDELKVDEKKYNLFINTYTWENAVDRLIETYHG